MKIYCEGDRHFLSAKSSDSRCVCDRNADFCCLLSKPSSLGKERKIKRKNFRPKLSLIRPNCVQLRSDQTNARLIPPLIIPFSSWSVLWSYHPQNEVTSDHTTPDRNELWSNYCALEPDPIPCNFGLGTHRVRWSWSDHSSLPNGTSNWVSFCAAASETDYKKKTGDRDGGSQACIEAGRMRWGWFFWSGEGWCLNHLNFPLELHIIFSSRFDERIPSSLRKL